MHATIKEIETGKKTMVEIRYVLGEIVAKVDGRAVSFDPGERLSHCSRYILEEAR